MASFVDIRDLVEAVQSSSATPAPARESLTTTEQAPAHEPEVWDDGIVEFNPRFAHTPEPPPVVLSPSLAEQDGNIDFDIDDYLKDERAKDLLRFSTAGSVDDGKSTLIGRLLYDTQSVYEDQLQSIEGKGTTAPGVLDLALLTDGLRAEREQGITIDVAYRYFSTARRKFIIADTPGHEQYTRNMATGASTADVAIVLVDARKGVLPQSRRHAYITALLGVRHVIVAVNKMDLVGYAESTFAGIRDAFTEFFAGLDFDGNKSGALGVDAADLNGHAGTTLHFVPVSALAGDNVVHRTAEMPWYNGPTLLALLESVPASEVARAAPFRMAVQRVIRPNLDFRGFAGQIVGGTVRAGDRVLVLPSGRSSRVERIVTYDGDLPEATAPLSVTLTLADEIDVSRGDLLVTPESPAVVTSAFTASLVWMDGTPLDLGRRYLLKHASRTVQAQVRGVLQTVDLSGLAEPAGGDDLPRQTDLSGASGSAGAAGSSEAHGVRSGWGRVGGRQGSAKVQPESSTALAMNGIGVVSIETLLPLAVDSYTVNRHTGSFVLIDALSNATVAAGMIRETRKDAAPGMTAGRVTEAERVARSGHGGAHLELRGTVEHAEALERALFDLGANVRLTDGPGDERGSTVAALVQAGLLVITAADSTLERPGIWIAIDGVETQVDADLNADIAGAVAAILRLLQHTVLRRESVPGGAIVSGKTLPGLESLPRTEEAR